MLIKQIEVDLENPYANDLLDRKVFVQQLVKLITNDEKSLILGLSGAWGTGKTTAVKFLVAEMEALGHLVISLNAWQDDFVSDPLISIVASITQDDKLDRYTGDPQLKENLKEYAKNFIALSAELGASLISRGSLSSGDFQQIIAINPEITQILNKYNDEKLSLQKLREVLHQITLKLKENGEKQLIIIIDELDRCKPTYAIGLFERIKHILDIENLTVLLSFDQRQLEATVKNYYGQDLDASRYLEKMFDIIINLPNADLTALFSKTFNELDLGNSQSFSDRSAYVRSLSRTLLDFLDASKASPREVERTLIRIKFLLNRSQGLWIDPMFAVVLLIVRNQKFILFEKILRGDFTFEDIDNHFKSNESTHKIWKSQLSDYVETLCYDKHDFIYDEENLLEVQLNTLNYSSLSKLQSAKWSRMQGQIGRIRRHTNETLPEMAQAINLIFQ